jgi:hypothetical protein
MRVSTGQAQRIAHAVKEIPNLRDVRDRRVVARLLGVLIVRAV